MQSRVRAYLCALKEGFSQVTKILPSPLQNWWRGCFQRFFLPKINNANPIWQTIGDAQYKGESQVIITGW
jgi:hypothetical protein